MARRIPQMNGDAPPPSTLAAQIVQNQTKAVPPQNGEAAPFTILIQELLTNPAAAQETDVGVNVRLISVVAEAGLQPLAHGNPFSPPDSLLPLANDSIAVIEKTVKRQPQVLFAPTSEKGPQLALTLFATLSSICGKASCSTLPLSSLFDSIICAVEASSELWRTAKTLKAVCQEIAEECLFSLETKQSIGGSVSLRVPPPKSIARLWPESENAIALPSGCQASVVGQAHAFMLALHLAALRSLDPIWRQQVHLRLQETLWQLRTTLQATRQWEGAVVRLLETGRSLNFVRLLLDDFDKVRPSSTIQTTIASALLSVLREGDTLALGNLLPAVQSVADLDWFGELNEDLRIAIVIYMTHCVPEAQLPEHVQHLSNDLRRDNVMMDANVCAALGALSVEQSHAQVCGRGRKRRKTSHESIKTAGPELISQTMRALTGVDSREASDLAESDAALYSSMDENEQCRVWHTLKELAALEPDVTLTVSSKLLARQTDRGAKRSRLLALFTIQACLQRATDSRFLDLAESQVGRTCISSLHSSIRELRIVGGQVLPLFLRDGLSDGLSERNRHTALEYLRQLSDRDVASEHETLISAWAQLALVCGDRELNLVLLRLIDYLGHANSVVSALACSEIEALAAAKSQTVEALLRPFWSTVAVSVVQDLHSRPQKAQLLCDLLHVDVRRFLLMTEVHTVPAMVLTKRPDLLQRLAAARGIDSVHEVILQPKTNLAATIGLLLTQPANNPEEAALECLAEVSPSFRGVDLANLVKMEPVLIACEMLKRSSDASEDRKSRVYRAIQLFASAALRRPGQTKPHQKLNRAVAEFFDAYILGVMAHFSQALEDIGTTYSATEKVRSLKAVRDLVKVTRNHASTALPQLRASLQSAMERPELVELAFLIWLDLLAVLEPDDVGQMLGQTFALIIRHWTSLPTNLHQRIHDGVSELMRVHNKIVQDNVTILPSLAGIELLSKYAADIGHLQSHESPETRCRGFTKRLQDQSSVVILQALRELVPFLIERQEFIHEAASSEQPVPILSDMMQAILDVTIKYSAGSPEVAELCSKAIGVIGCLDPNRVDCTRERRRVLVLSNFDKATEAVDWVVAMLEDVIVRAFKSVSNARAQGFLAYTMQEMLKFCSFTHEVTARTRSTQAPSVLEKWMAIPEHVRITLTPFLSSHYHISNVQLNAPTRKYPGFSTEADYGSWLRSLVYDLVLRAKGDNPKMVFPLIARLVRALDISIAKWMLPYAVLNVVLGGTVPEVDNIRQELLAVLQCQPSNHIQMETVKQSAETVFSVLDYMSTWLREKKKILSQTRADAYKTGVSPSDFDEVRDMAQVEEIERFLSTIPAEALATRAVDCGSFSRALFNWEQYIRQGRELVPSPRMSQSEEQLYDRLHDIYACIDEPDGLEGIGAHLSFLTEEQQTIQHIKAGRWTAASAWYEMQLADKPVEEKSQLALLNCMRQTGQYTTQKRYAQAFLAQAESEGKARLMPLVVEAQWMSGDLSALHTQLSEFQSSPSDLTSMRIGEMLCATLNNDEASLARKLSSYRISIAQSMTEPGTSSLQACHDELRTLHAVYEVEAMNSSDEGAIERFLERSDKRLAALGAYNADKQFLLALRRAVMAARRDNYNNADMGKLWLTTARLARKAGNGHSAYNAVLRAYECGEREAKLEEARLLWHDGHTRQAIHALESAIASGVFEAAEESMDVAAESTVSTVSTSTGGSSKHNMLVAKAQLLLAKWLDVSGQTQAKDMTSKYQSAAKNCQRWEKGHYYLGKHYQKLLEAEKALPKNKQSMLYHSGEMTRLVVENLMRSIPFGNKYWHETIPKILTLWLDMGMETLHRGTREDAAVYERRAKSLQSMNKQFQKYYERIPAYVFYQALPQMISRITHPHPDVWRQLSSCLVRIVSTHPSQAMWYLLPVPKAVDEPRAARGMEIVNKLKSPKKEYKSDGVDVKALIAQSQKLSGALLMACEQPIEPRRTQVSLKRDLHFNDKLAPIPLVVPVESSLMINLPTDANSETIRRHKAFAQEKVTVQKFEDDVLVLNSLQRPRKIVVRGSDGKQYGLLCKPKDDLRKDQRLMEFNGIINRALKRDAESSKRRLYIKTYAVTPLSEESGTLEWVEGIKPMRDILLTGYQRKGTRVDYGKIKDQLNKAVDTENPSIFSDEILPQFPPILHEWFTETYTEPEAWFAARLRYARSAAVMSMTGHVLGLGDRHGENILLEESTGGVFHVDFNCLFDKGRTFEKPELVPFRLTHNMVDAMGPYGYEGPFRKSSELTLGLLRQNKDTLMTVLETFLYDPTTDFAGTSKKKRHTEGVPETPQEILDSVDAKLRGLFRGENVPLGVEGYCDVLIRDAVSPGNLAGMYIGWCAFL